MLQIQALHLDDFGPFKGHQRDFFLPATASPSFMNMRGKTSLLNAIRFAFFGRCSIAAPRQCRYNRKLGVPLRVLRFQIALGSPTATTPTSSPGRVAHVRAWIPLRR